MQSAKDSLKNSRLNFQFLKQLSKEKLDSIVKTTGSLGFHFSIGTTKISNGNYEGFKSSGKIGIIENKELKKNILKYYQEMTTNILEAENINAEQILKLTDFWNENADQDFKKNFLNPKFKAKLGTILSMTKNSPDLYQSTISLAKEIINKINKQVE